MLGEAQLLTIIDGTVITFLNTVILASSAFTESLITVRWALEYCWRTRTGTAWGHVAGGLYAPQTRGRKAYRVNRNLTILSLRVYCSLQLLYIKGMDGVWGFVMVASS